MRTISRWITLGGKHIPIFEGESVRIKTKNFKENKGAYKALQSKAEFKKYIENEFKDVNGIEKIYLSKENKHGQWRSLYKRKRKIYWATKWI